MKASRIGLTMGLMALGTAAMALPGMVKDFGGAYNVSKSSALGKASCTVCHIGYTKKLNPYGADLKAALAGSKALTADVLKKVEGKDSDGDGVKNIDEIKADKLPGDPKSK